MINHEEKAHELFKQGYNCAQSVFAAFCDVTGMDFETAIKLTSGFGAGMGGMRDTCGAVTGMFMVADMQEGAAAHGAYRRVLRRAALHPPCNGRGPAAG